jgi:hypothetical protein
MVQHGRGGAAPGKGQSGGNRGGAHEPERSGRGPNTGHQAQGKDPKRGQPG